MDLNTSISTAARRIARESQAGHRVFFTADGEVVGRLIGPFNHFTKQFAVCTNGKATQREAQDQLDALTIEDGFARNSYAADVADARTYMTQVAK